MQEKYIVDSQSRFLIEGQTQPQVQILYLPLPQQQYQMIPQNQQQNLLYNVQGAQQNPNNIINDSNFCSNMCCTLTWFIFALIVSIGNFFLLINWFYLLLNIIYIISALLILISICSRNTKIYKAGYVFYYIYVIMNAIPNILIVIIIWVAPDVLSFLGFYIFFDNYTEKEKTSIEQILMAYKVIFTLGVILQIGIASSILECLKNKIKVFQAYEDYLRMNENLLNQQKKLINSS